MGKATNDVGTFVWGGSSSGFQCITPSHIAGHGRWLEVDGPTSVRRLPTTFWCIVSGPNHGRSTTALWRGKVRGRRFARNTTVLDMMLLPSAEQSFPWNRSVEAGGRRGGGGRATPTQTAMTDGPYNQHQARPQTDWRLHSGLPMRVPTQASNGPVAAMRGA